MKIDIRKLQVEMARNEMLPRDLANKSGIPLSTIYNFTSGRRNPNTKNLGRISKALQVDVLDLIKD